MLSRAKQHHLLNESTESMASVQAYRRARILTIQSNLKELTFPKLSVSSLLYSVLCLVTQLCPILCDHMSCSLPSTSVTYFLILF